MASNVNINKSSPADYNDNPTRPPTAGYAHPDREYQPPVEVVDWRVVLARVVAVLIGYIIYSLWKTGYCWSGVRYGQCDAIAEWEPRVLIGGVALGIVLLAWHYSAKIQIVQAQANRTNLVLNRYRNYQPADLFNRMDGETLMRYLISQYAMDTQLERDTAEWKRLWSVNNLSGDGQTSISTSIAPMLDSGDAQPTGLIADSEWMPWIDRTPHLLLSARTNAGKTTLATAILAARAGEQLLILDPHDQPDKWFGLRAIGGGRNFDAILSALAGVLDEMDRRYVEYNDGKETDAFDRLTVLIDETPALVAHTMDGQRTTDARWKNFAKKLGSEARKVRISAILLTQSPLVQDIQISTYMRENFTRVALGDQVTALLSEEKDTARRQTLADLLRGREYAAAMEYKNEIHVLNTDNVPTLARRPATHLAQMWAPPQPAQRVVAASAQPSETVRASVPSSPPPVLSTRSQIAWYAANTDLSTRAIRERLRCDYSLVVDIAGKVRSPAGAAIREQYRRIA